MQKQSIYLSNYIKKVIPFTLFSIDNNNITFYINSKKLINFVTFIKRHSLTKVDQLIDITAVDFPQRKMRFEVLYQFMSVMYNQRFTVSICINEINTVNSISSLYASAG